MAGEYSTNDHRLTRAMRRTSSRSILLSSLLAAALLVPMTLLGAPTGPKLPTAPKVQPGPRGIAKPGPSIRLPSAATRTTTRLVPNLPGGPKPAGTPGMPWFYRTYGSVCYPGVECGILGRNFGQHAPGQNTPTGRYLSFYPAGSVITDMKLTPTAWTTSLIAFVVPATMHDGVRYTVLIRDAQGKAVSNGITILIRKPVDPNVDRDADDDGEDSIAAGGSDCDDFDNNRRPGRTEVADANDHDEDCNDETFGIRDDDGDGSPDVRACNISMNGTGLDRTPLWVCGSDCDDTRLAIKPGELSCDPRDRNIIFLCKAQRSWTIDPRITPTVGFNEPHDCDLFAPPNGQCVDQPNGRGVCQAAP
jgi:hypothetical protein